MDLILSALVLSLRIRVCRWRLARILNLICSRLFLGPEVAAGARLMLAAVENHILSALILSTSAFVLVLPWRAKKSLD